MRLTKSQHKFLENLNHWVLYRTEKQDDGTYFCFVCPDHNGGYDTTREYLAKSFQDLAEQIEYDASGFDPEEETLLWANEVGLGNRGVPDSLRALLDEFTAYKRELGDLSGQFKKFANSSNLTLA